METNQITLVVLAAVYMISWLLVLVEASDRQIGLAWASIVALLATPVVAVVCVAMSPRVHGKRTVDFYREPDYRFEAARELGDIQVNPMAEYLCQQPRYQRLDRLVNEDPEHLFNKVRLVHKAKGNEEIISMKEWIKWKEKGISKSYKVSGYF